jgi:hypothetical protein
LKCVETAKEIRRYLEKQGLHGIQIKITDPAQRGIWSNTFNGTITQNGYHTGILFNDLVYDNIHKLGIPLDKWLEDFIPVIKLTVDYSDKF